MTAKQLIADAKIVADALNSSATALRSRVILHQSVGSTASIGMSQAEVASIATTLESHARQIVKLVDCLVLAERVAHEQHQTIMAFMTPIKVSRKNHRGFWRRLFHMKHSP